MPGNLSHFISARQKDSLLRLIFFFFVSKSHRNNEGKGKAERKRAEKIVEVHESGCETFDAGDY